MGRYIDDVIKVVQEHPHMSAVHKKVLIKRIEMEPTREELDAALVEFQNEAQDKMEKKERYINKSNKKEVYIATKRDGMVEVKYIVSGMRAWFKMSDFARIFREK